MDKTGLVSRDDFTFRHLPNFILCVHRERQWCMMWSNAQLIADAREYGMTLDEIKLFLAETARRQYTEFLHNPGVRAEYHTIL